MKKIELKNLILFLGLMGLMLSLPSIVYLIFNGNIDEYSGQNYYFLTPNGTSQTIAGVIIYILITIFSFIFYFGIMKKSNEFKSIKAILLTVLFVGIMFMICLPNTTTDVFYYMGTGRVLAKYHENPYYVTIADLINSGITNDAILNHSGYWSNTVPPYGPIWTALCAFFSLLSFGNNTALLYIYKIFSLAVHIATCYIVYKITNKKKFALMYGLNPFLLTEFLTNVHNDLYLVFFVMLAIYFLKKKNNIWLALVSLSCSILVKYVTVIFAPFLALYYLRDKNKLKKFLWCIVYAIFVIAIVITVYSFFFNNIADFLNILKTQQGRIKESIYLILTMFELDDWLSPVNNMFLALFVITMIFYVLVAFFKKEKFSNYMDDTKNLLWILIFGVLTNFTAWYLSWFFVPIYWLKSKSIKNIFYVQFLFMLTYSYLLYHHSDATAYEAIVWILVLCGVIIRFLYKKIRKIMEETNCIKTKKLS